MKTFYENCENVLIRIAALDDRETIGRGVGDLVRAALSDDPKQWEWIERQLEDGIREAQDGGPLPVTRSAVMDFSARLGILLHETEKPSWTFTRQVTETQMSLCLLDAVMARDGEARDG